MTFEFDFLETLFFHYKRLNKDWLKPLLEKLADIAIEQINKRRPKRWNYNLWKQKYRKLWRDADELTLKYYFISDTHDFLDHDPSGKWHHKVFTRDFLQLLYILDGLFRTGTYSINKRRKDLLEKFGIYPVIKHIAEVKELWRYRIVSLSSDEYRLREGG